MFRKISNAIIILFLVCALAVLAVLGIPFLLGNKLYAVKTASMVPTYPIGSIVVVKSVGPDAIKENDVITFRSDAFTSLVTHRVIKVDAENREFYTKGDNNKNPDFHPVPFDYMEGKVIFGIPYLGNIVTGMRTPGGILIMLWILLGIALLLFLPELAKKEPQPALAEGETAGKRQKHSAGRRQEAQPGLPRRKLSKKEAQAEARFVYRAQMEARAAQRRKQANEIVENNAINEIYDETKEYHDFIVFDSDDNFTG